MDETVFYYETSLSEALDIMKSGLPEARYVLDQWRQEYNCRRPQPTRHPANGGQSRTHPEYWRGKNWGK